MGQVSTRIEVLDPTGSTTLARMVVPGEVTKEAIRKELHVGVSLVVDLGDKKKRKTFTIKIFDDDLKRALEAYVDSLRVLLTTIESEEHVAGEYTLGEIRD